MQQPQQQQQFTVMSGGGVYTTNSPGGQFQPVTTTTAGNPSVGYLTVQPVVPAVVRTNFAESYQHRQSVGLGVTLVVIGILSMIFNAVGLGVNDYLSVVGHGFWCGSLFIITGGFGIGAKNKNRCLIVTFMIMCIFSAIFTIFLLGFGAGGAANNNYCVNYYYYSYYYYYCNRAGAAMEALQAVLAILAAIVSIWGSAICCRAVCCCTTQPIPFAMTATPYGNQQVTIITTQQQQQSYGVQYPAAPTMAQVQPVHGSPYYQPQQQTWAPQTQQPFQPGVHGTAQSGHYPSAPAYTPYGEQGFNGPAAVAPPSYAAAEASKMEPPSGSYM